VLTAVFEFEARAGDQILDSARHHDLGRLCERAHPLTNVDRYPADVVAPDLDLAGVQADTNIQVQVRGCVADGNFFRLNANIPPTWAPLTAPCCRRRTSC
jgi:hypothetical protein